MIGGVAKLPNVYVNARRASFLAAGADYDRARPDYPVHAIEWILGGRQAMDVVDLGCGSGKLATQLVAAGHRVVGVDPSLELLRVAAAKGIVATCGRAEALPLRDASADVVTVAQAFHWFDHQPAVPEMRRTLRRGGRVGLLWNLRDESVDWVRELSSIIGSEDAMARTLGRIDEMGADVERKLRHDGDFPIVEQEIFDHFQELSEEGLSPSSDREATSRS